jgi:GTP-binding protein
MKFIDRAVIRVTAGTGGSGCMSFRREAFVPKGGPDGGDGGRGGSIYVRADPHLTTLLDYRYKSHRKADRGQHGMGSDKTGKSGDDVHLPVPPGTVVNDADSGDAVGEVLEPGDELLIARGGRGGRGNARFATATHQAPREWEPGEEGEDRSIELVLKLIADVALVGEPNAGKSTLLSVVSAAKPKIADYPFTTLTPQLGVVQLPGSRTFVMADIPGIIEGAHEGRGLGDQFLQHIERTTVLAYLVSCEQEDLDAAYARLRDEVRAYSPLVARKPHIVVVTKTDLLPADAGRLAVDAPAAAAVLALSAVAQRGLDKLTEQLWQLLRTSDTETAEPDTPAP